MIINFSYNPDEILDSLHKFEFKEGHETLLDLTGVCKNIEDIESISVSDLDKDFKIAKRSLHALFDFAEKASTYKSGNASIRRFRFQGLSFFWLTGISEKHDSRHWGQQFFLLRQLIQEKPDFFARQDKICIILPQLYHTSIPWLKQLIKKALNYEPKILPAKPKSWFVLHLFWVSIKFLQDYSSSVFFGRKAKYYQRAMEVKTDQLRNVFISDEQLFLQGKTEFDRATNRAWQKSLKSGTFSYILPVPHSAEAIKGFKWENTDREFLRALPGLGQIFSIFFHCFWNQLKILSLKRTVFTFQDEQIPSNVIYAELAEKINYIWYQFSTLWLKNYFKTLQGKASVFYVDEFYIVGRGISHAIKSSPNEEITCYGFQHGIFFLEHSVYCLRDKELNAVENGRYPGIPVPDYFLVWGSFFKKYFLSNNSLPDAFIQEVGNIRYLEAENGQEVFHESSSILRILWCTTLMPYAVHEYQIFVDALLNLKKAYHLTVRLHPKAHITKTQIKELLDNRIHPHLSFDAQRDIQDSFKSNDLIICTGFSTTFLDAVMAKKHTCKIMPDNFGENMSELNAIPFLHVVRKADEFTELIKNIHYDLDESLLGLDQISYRKADKWDSILTGKQLNPLPKK